MTEQKTAFLGIKIEPDLKSLAEQVSKSRGEGLSSFVRRSILKELASLSFLPDEQKKALGIQLQDAEETDEPEMLAQ